MHTRTAGTKVGQASSLPMTGKMPVLLYVALAILPSSIQAQLPENLVVEQIPSIPAELKADASRYLEFRSASLNSWHPTRREILITTRFADSSQLHLVKMPGGARKQLTFL